MNKIINKYDIRLKYIILGDAGVGKTSIIKRKSDDTFLNTYSSTIGVDYINLKMSDENYNFNIAIWDTAGQEKFRNIINVYYRAITAAIIVYDITDLNSFNNIEDWIGEIKVESPNCYIIIVGNKVDLQNERQVFSEHIDQLKCKDNNYLFLECSSKTNFNIDTIFENLIDKISGELQEGKIKFDDSNGIQVYKNKLRISRFIIEENKSVKKNKGCCIIL